MAVSAPTAASQEQRDRPRRRLPTWVRRLVWGLSIGVLVLALFALVAVLFFSDRVIGPSMLPGLHSGDRVLVNPLAYAFGTPQRGDVVEVIPPAGPRGAAVKRVVGLPGDELEIRPASDGQPPAVFIRPDGKGGWYRLIEPYLGSAGVPWLGCCDSAGRATERPRPFRVPAGEYFVLGDNRSVSYDSMDYGPVPRGAIQGKVVSVILPLSRFAPVGQRPTIRPAHI
jgi:signal peptidase I